MFTRESTDPVHDPRESTDPVHGPGKALTPFTAWQDAVFELYLSEEKLETEVIENRSWPHCGFSVDQSVFLPTLVKSVRFGSDGNLFALETAATSVRVWRLREVRKRLADLKLDWWMVPPGS